jgi:hypothetical protein
MGTTAVAPQAKLSTAGANALAIAAIRNNSVAKRINLPNAMSVGAAATIPGQILTVPLQNVGFLRGVLMQCVMSVTNNDPTVPATPSDFAGANMFSQIVYNDLANVTRVQTTGAHIFMLDSLRRQGIMGAAYTHDVPGTYGSVLPINLCPTVAAAGGTAQVIWYFYLPVAYSDTDLRGAVFSNITNANQSVQCTINPTMCVPTGTDNVNAVYTGPASANMVINSVSINPFQDVYDQLPDYRYLPPGITPNDWQMATGDRSGLMLPSWSMRWMYELKYSPFLGIVANVENPFPYTNQRQFLSTILEYQDPTRVTNNVTYFRLVAANSYEWWKMTARTTSFESRRLLGDDFPAGFYVFDSRTRPINTIVSGNLQLVMLASTANTGAKATLYYEDFALVATVTGASSLAAGTN